LGDFGLILEGLIGATNSPVQTSLKHKDKFMKTSLFLVFDFQKSKDWIAGLVWSSLSLFPVLRLDLQALLTLTILRKEYLWASTVTHSLDTLSNFPAQSLGTMKSLL
jgi:hypothetical protein